MVYPGYVGDHLWWRHFAAAVQYGQFCLEAKQGEPATLVSSLPCCQRDWNAQFPGFSSDAMTLTSPTFSLLIRTPPAACPKQGLWGFSKASVLSCPEIVSHLRPSRYNIHLALTGKAIKSQRKLESSHIYAFPASSQGSTEISGCLKKNKPWKCMYAHTHSEFLQGETFVTASSTVLPQLSLHNIWPLSLWSWDDTTLLLNEAISQEWHKKYMLCCQVTIVRIHSGLWSSYGKGLQKQKCL